MPEMIIPGTYIEVRAEGLIRPGPFAIGNVGIVGTAQRGKLGNPAAPGVPTVYRPANIGEAREIFGLPDAFDAARPPNTRELTLIRALELAYANGAQNVYAVRVDGSTGAPATYTLGAATGSLAITSVAPGAGYNGAVIATSTITSGVVDLVSISLDGIVETWRNVPAAVAEFVQVLNDQHPSYNYSVNSSTGGASNLFTFATGGASGNVNANATATAGATPGANGPNATATEYGAGLTALVNQDVHIVVLAGQSDAAFVTSLISHVQTSSNDANRRERIGVIGSAANPNVSSLTVPAQDEGRLVFVTPGVRVTDPISGRVVALSGGYAAAAVAGLISSLDPHASPTNKTISAVGLERNFNATDLQALLLNRALPLEERNGAIRIVRGLTTATNPAWSQITTRRIVDFAKFGVRAASNPFIGKLNNERVRAALKGSINSFMADMVDREMLISYELEVSATRDQQIRGIAQVTMVVRPTFSIDFIRVVMYLE
jgi:hypothetical protein